MKDLSPLAFPPLHGVAGHRLPTARNRSLVGTSLGALVLLAVALSSQLLFGGVTGAQLADGVLWIADAPSFGATAFVLLCVVFAVSPVASFFAVGGADEGASIGAQVEPVKLAPRTPLR